eukprot:365535-Chlamydomonas_euryale.AAC.82
MYLIVPSRHSCFSFLTTLAVIAAHTCTLSKQLCCDAQAAKYESELAELRDELADSRRDAEAARSAGARAEARCGDVASELASARKMYEPLVAKLRRDVRARDEQLEFLKSHLGSAEQQAATPRWKQQRQSVQHQDGQQSGGLEPAMAGASPSQDTGTMLQAQQSAMHSPAAHAGSLQGAYELLGDLPHRPAGPASSGQGGAQQGLAAHAGLTASAHNLNNPVDKDAPASASQRTVVAQKMGLKAASTNPLFVAAWARLPHAPLGRGRAGSSSEAGAHTISNSGTQATAHNHCADDRGWKAALGAASAALLHQDNEGSEAVRNVR